MEDELTRGDPAAETGKTAGEPSAESGYVTTEVAAAGLGVSPRTVRDYIKAGKLQAKPEGEGGERRWRVSVDSLHTLRQFRQGFAVLPRKPRHHTPRGENAAGITGGLDDSTD